MDTQLTTVVSYPERGEGGDNKYRGNCSPKLIQDLIAHLGVKEICDYMCGSNTTRDAANTTGIVSHTYDLHSGFDLTQHDIPERSEFTFWHPPYHSIITYSDVMYSASDVERHYGYDPRKTDLSRIPSWDEFVKSLNFCMMKQFCALDTGGRMAVLVGDIKRKGKLFSMILELVKPGTLENIIIKTQHNCVSDSTRYSGSFIPIVHEYLLLLRKDGPLRFDVLQTRRFEADIRDLENATWKDVVAEVMDSLKGAAELERIYTQVEQYRRAKAQSHWREKVRQTLQLHPTLFHSPTRGTWSHIKYAR